MAILGQGANLTATLGGKETDGIRDVREIQTSISFQDGAIQGSIVTEELTFVRDARQTIIDHREGGLSGGVGVLEGIPLTLEVFNIESGNTLLDGFVDASQAKYNDSAGEILAPIVKKDSLEVIDSRLSGLTFGYLESKGVFKDTDYTDIDYVVEKTDTAFETPRHRSACPVKTHAQPLQTTRHFSAVMECRSHSSPRRCSVCRPKRARPERNRP